MSGTRWTSLSRARLCTVSLVVGVLLIVLALEALSAAAAGPVPPPTFVPPIEGSFYGATQATIAGPMGLDVSLYDLSLRAIRNDIFLPGCSLPLQATFIYESRWRSSASPFGYGWRYLYAASYQVLSDGSLIVGPIEGQMQRLWPGSGGLTRPQAGRYELRTSRGLTYYFDDPSHKQVTKIADSSGSSLVLTYDTSGKLTRVTDRYGRHLDFSYSGGRLVSVTDANATPTRTVQYAYDAAGNLTGVTDPLGHTTSYSYSASHGLSQITAPRGNWAKITYSSDGDKVSQVATSLSAVNFAHVEFERLFPSLIYENYTTVTDVVGGQTRSTRYDFTRNGQLYQITDPEGHKTWMTRDLSGNLLQLIDGNNNVIRYQYDSAGRLIKTTDPLSRTTSYTYDPVTGQVASITDPLGHTRRYEYDSKGNLIRLTDPLSNTTRFAYDCCHLISVTDALSNTISYSYDTFGNLTAVRDGAGITATFRYDARGNLLQAADGLGRITRYGRDALGRVITITNPAGESYRLSYDANGNLSQLTDPAGRTIHYAYDGLDRPFKLSDALGEMTYAYDSSGNFSAITDGQGHQDTFEYDRQGRILRRSDGLNRATTFAYDAAGNLIRRTDPLSQTTVYTYNAANLLTAVRYPDGSLVTYTYDAAGNLTRQANATVTVDYTYDAANRVTSVTAGGRTVRYTYDAAGRRASMTDPDGNVTTYSYDAAGRLRTVADPLAGTTTYTYDAAGKISRVDRANGVYTLYSYDAAGRLRSLSHHAAGSTVLASYTYTYDRAGNRTSVTDDQGRTTSYTYDSRYRLTGVTYPDGTSTTYTYDRAGNRLTENGTAYSYDAADQLLSAGATVYGWDARGNPASETTGGLVTSYSFDHENRLTRVSFADGTSVSYSYYPDGRLYSRTDRAGQISYFFYDGPNLLLEADAGGSTVARYTSGLALDSWLAVRRGGQTYTYLRDALNSVVGLADSNGALVASYLYDAFGAARSQTGSMTNPLRFTGRYWDGDAGLYHYRARWYEPTSGRFLSRDPLGPIRQPEPYVYASNNPATLVDPLGLDTWSCDSGKGSLGFLLGVEYAKVRCRNQRTGETCSLTQWCFKLGALAGASASGCGGFQFNGPASGQDLGGGGFSVFGELGGGFGVGGGIEGNLSTNDPASLMNRPGELNLCGGGGYAGLETGLGGQYCSTSVNQCDKREDEPDHEPRKPPRPPDHDHADDNASAASRTLPIPNIQYPIPNTQYLIPNPLSLVGQPRVGILWHGYAEEAQALLASWGWASVAVDLDFAPAALNVPVLVIPSGGLFGLESARSLRARLEAYAAAGGAIIALAQQHGYEFSSLPGGQVAGYGWTEDNSCFDASLYISQYHPILAGFRKTTLTAGVDGFFTSQPTGAHTLLHRTKNGQPALILYPYPPPSEKAAGGGLNMLTREATSGGYIVATSLYDDWGGANHQPPADSQRLLRDLLSWAVDPDGPLPEFRPGASVTVPLTITNSTATDAARIEITVLDADGAVFSQQAFTQTVPAGGQVQLALQLASLPARLGIWWTHYTLLDSSGKLVQPAAWGGRFAVSDPSPVTGPDKAMGLSITAPGEVFNPGPATFTFHVYNLSDTPRQATVNYGLPHHTWQTADPAYGNFYDLSRTITVAARSETTFTHTANILTNDRLFARLTYDSVRQYTWFQVRSQPVSVQVSAATDQPEYRRGQMVQVTVTLTEAVQAATAPTLHLVAWDARRTVLFSAQQVVNLAPGETRHLTFNYTVPDTAQAGTATLRAEVRDAAGQPVGTGSSSFAILNSPLAFATALPASLVPGATQSLDVTATNASPTQDVLTATLAVTLTDPAGTSLPLTLQPFALPAGQSLALNVPFTTPAVRFGVYTFTLTSQDNYGSQTWQVTAPNRPLLSINLDRSTYRVRDLLRAEVAVGNSGRWQQSPSLRVELPAAGYVQSTTLPLAAASQTTADYQITLPATLAAGSYPISATLILTNGAPLATAGTVVIPNARLRATLADAMLSAGSPATITVANDGGVDTAAAYRARLQDARGMVVQAATGNLANIQAGGSTAFTITVPAAAVSGDYRVQGVLTNTQAGRASPFTLLATVDGLQAGLVAATERPIYTQGEPITAAATITNTGSYAMHNATLHLAVEGPPTWRWFTHRPGQWGPASRVSTIMADSNGVKWLAAANVSVSAFDDRGTPFDKSDDRWQVFDTLDGIPYQYVRLVFVDAADYKWIVSWYTSLFALSVLDDGGTPFDKSDDRWFHYTAAEGLPDHVAAIAQDAAGNLWLAHVFNGVSVLDPGPDRLDSSDDTWYHFTTANSGLADDSLNAILIDGDDNKWFATNGGVSVLDDGDNPFDGSGDTWYTYYWGTGLPHDTVWAMTIDNDGNKWFGGYLGGVSVLDSGASPFDGSGDTWRIFDTYNSGLAGDQIFSLAVDSSDNKWIGVGYAANVLDTGADPFDGSGDTWDTFANDYLLGDVKAIYPEAGDLVWFGADVLDSGGLALLDHGGTPFSQADDAWEAFTSDAGLGTSYIDSIVAGPGGLTWLAGSTNPASGFRVLDDGGTPADPNDDQWMSFHPADGLPSDAVRALALDRAGIVWAGTNVATAALDHGGTPFDKSDDGWQTFGLGDIGVDTVNVIAVDNANRKWIGGYGQWGAATLAVLDDGGTPLVKTDDLTTTFTAADGLPGMPYALAVDQAGVKWISVWDRVAALWDAGTPFTKTDDVWVTFSTANGLPSGNIRAIAVDAQNNIWFAVEGSGGGVGVLDYNGTLDDTGDDIWHTYDSSDGLVSNWASGIAVDAQGDKWIGTGFGVSWLDDGDDPFDGLDDTWRTFTTAHGLPDAPIQVVALGGDGNIWVGTFEGGVSVALRGGAAAWSASVPLSSLPPAQVTQTLTAVTGLNDPGRYRLTADLASASGQTIVSDRAPFYIVPGHVALTLDARPDPVRPAAAITVTAALINNGTAGLTNQTVTLAQDGAIIHTEGPFDVPPGSSHPFTVVTTAPADGDSTTFTASNGDLSIEQEVVVGRPLIVASASAPPVVGSDPFSVTISLTNTGAIAGQVVISYQLSVNSEQWVVDVPAGETVLVQGSAQVCADTRLPITLTGDLTETLSVPVTFGQALDAAFSPQPVYPPGFVAIPYTFTNTGQLDIAFTTVVTMTDPQSPIASFQFDTYLPAGNATAGSALFDLPTGAYTLTYGLRAGVCSLGSGQERFNVAPETSVALSATAGVPGPSIPVTVTLTNTGSESFAGTLQLSTDYGYQVVQPAALAVSASGVYTFAADTSLASAGVHTATVSAVTAAGVVVAQAQATFTVQGPALRISSLPENTLLPVSQTVTVTFGVENSGDQAGQVRLRFALGDMEDETQVRLVEAGASESFAFAFFVPPELEAKDYLAIYDLNGGQGELVFTVQGISLTVSAGTDQPAYAEGEPVTFLLTVTNQAPTAVPNLYALVSLGGITQTQSFTLPGANGQISNLQSPISNTQYPISNTQYPISNTQYPISNTQSPISHLPSPITLTFPLTATFSDGGLVFYGIYHQASQRGIHLNTYRLSQRQGTVSILLDRPVYAPGDTVQATVLTTVTGQLDVAAPGYTTTLALAGVNTGFSFDLPPRMSRGSYALQYRLTGCACDQEGRQYLAWFDVAGPLVRVTEARLDQAQYSPGDQVNAWLTVASDQDVDVLLRSGLSYPDGVDGATSQQAAHLAASLDNVLTATATITGAQAGLHLFSYELLDAADPTLVYAEGAEAFDVGLASLLDVTTDQRSYPTASDPVTVMVQLYASQALTGQLSLTLNDAVPQVETVSLTAGRQTVVLDLAGPIAPGRRTLTATLAVGALASQAQTAFDYGTDLPDLVANPPAVIAIQPGSDQALTLLVFNQGASTAGATSIAAYDGDPDGGGTLIGTAAVPALDSGASAAVNLPWNVSTHAPASEVLVSVQVDPDGSIAEFDETNNLARSPVTLPPSCPEDTHPDWHVDLLDLQAVASGWGGSDPRLDVDRDGDIDIVDIMRVATRWGQDC